MVDLFNIFKSRKPVGRVAFNMKPIKGPWGGSSVFVTQLSAFLKWRGYEVCFDLNGRVDAIILIDPRQGSNKPFGAKEIAEYKRSHPNTAVLHRINECDKRKNTSFMDDMLAIANEVADYTVFISEWVRDYHAVRWFNDSRPHCSIYNGADPRIFHPMHSQAYDNHSPFRIVTHHWSDNPMKGFGVYQQVDKMIAEGELESVELWIIGRWPENIKWRNAKTFPPTSGVDMANKLRSCHAYITASLWEPCGMHHVEGAQCGLPLIYHEDGGGINEAGLKYGIGFRSDVKSAILKMRDEYPVYRRNVLELMPSGDRMCIEYIEIVQRLISGKLINE